MSGDLEALENGGAEAVEDFVRDQLGDYADDVLGYMLGAVCSFSADTLVSTEQGLIPISDVAIGEYILAYNEATGETGYYTVEAVWAHLDHYVVHLTIDGDEIETTPEHPLEPAKARQESRQASA